MRPHHCVKNFLVFAALACSGQFFDLDKLPAAAIGFLVFCLTSSAVYVINDIRDRERDRAHPVKCRRPIASGAVAVRNAWILAALLLGGAAGCSLRLAPVPALIPAAYLLLNLAYSFGGKDIPLADVCILAAGFLLRVLYGGVITGIEISDWLYLTVLALAFFLSLGKRRNELRRTSGGTRPVLAAYSESFLDRAMYMCLTLTNVFYALWAVDEQTQARYHHRYLIWTVPLVLVITLKYSLNVERDCDGDPVEVLLGDRALVGLCLLYLAVMFVMLYLM